MHYYIQSEKDFEPLRSHFSKVSIYIKMVLPAEAGSHDCTGFRVKPGMATLNLFTGRSNNIHESGYDAETDVDIFPGFAFIEFVSDRPGRRDGRIR